MSLFVSIFGIFWWSDNWLISVTELHPCYLLWWKYQQKWIHNSHRLQPQSYFHYGGSICESDLSVHNSNILLPPCYLKVVCQSTTVTACSRRTTSMLLFLVEDLWKWFVIPRQSQPTVAELPPCWWKYLWKLFVSPRWSQPELKVVWESIKLSFGLKTLVNKWITQHGSRPLV